MAVILQIPAEGRAMVSVYERTIGGRPRYEVRWKSGGIRKRKTFSTQDDAERLARKVYRQIGSGSTPHETISEADAALLRKARLIGTHEIDRILEKKSRLTQSATVSDLRDRFLQIYEHRAKRTRDDIRTRFAHIEDAFGPRLVDTLTTAEIEDWYFAISGSSRTKNNFLAILNAFLNQARDWEYLPHDRSTASARVRKIRPLRKDPGILTPGEAKTILHDAPPDLLPYLTLGMFAGLRPSEISGVIGERSGLIRSDIDLDALTIRIRREVAGKTGRPRVVEMKKNLASWLSPLLQDLPPTSPVSARSSYMRFTELNKSHEWKIPWPRDGLRHSFVSYYFALTGNKSRTAQQAGNSERVIDESYNNPRSIAEAEAYFALTPASVGRPLGDLRKPEKKSSD